MSWMSYVTATSATLLVAAVIGCDGDPASPEPDPDPISIAGDYDYAFEFTNGEEGEAEVSCEGQGVITITQPSDSTFSGETAADGTLKCAGFQVPIDEESGIVNITGEITDTGITLEFPLIEEELCDASGIIEDDAATLSGSATCLVDPAALGISGEPVELTGGWQADRTTTEQGS